jgi:hypothetical protein
LSPTFFSTVATAVVDLKAMLYGGVPIPYMASLLSFDHAPDSQGPLRAIYNRCGEILGEPIGHVDGLKTTEAWSISCCLYKTDGLKH